MTTLIEALLDIIQEAGVRPILDMNASNIRPCIQCGREGPNELAIVGTHASKAYREAPLRRPVCVGCLARLREVFGMVKAG